MQRLRILMIEDSRGDAALVSHVLAASEDPSFDVTAAGSVAEARERLSQRFDVVLLDLSLPDSNGLRTLRNIQGAAPRVPIVVLSRSDDPEMAARCLEWGASGFLVKGRDGATEVCRALCDAVERSPT
jgi:DNA-binding NarL/FixJ family response regulator